MPTSDSFLPPHGGYEKLASYQKALIVYDATRYFCRRFVSKRDRTYDQMIQAARSGKQNIVEGSQISGTSKKLELNLTNVARASLEELLQRADVVSIHVKLTDQSRGLIGERELARMKAGSLLLNGARGPVVDTNALVKALNSDHLGGAGIDVYDEEPVPADHPLLACEQVVLTPHCADMTPEGVALLNSGAVDNVIAYLEGRSQNRVT